MAHSSSPQPEAAARSEPGGRRLVTHYGPAVGSQGGMASVLEAYGRLPLERHHFEFVSTWHPDDRLFSARRFVLAVGDLVLRRRRRGSVVHVHLAERGSYVREGAIVVLAAVLRRAVVVSHHGAEFGPFAARHPRLVRAVLGRADRVLALGPASRAELEPYAAHVEAVPNPAELPPPAGPPSAAPEVVLFAGENGRRKGLDVLLAAWPAVRARRPGARLVVAGPPGDVDVPRTDGVEALGPVPRRDVAKRLAEARVAVLPSRAEVMPMFVLEALGAGRPVVGTPVGDMASMLDEGGVVVPVGDAGALAGALGSLLGDPGGLDALGAAARASAERRYTPHVVAAALEAVYDAAAAGHRSPARRSPPRPPGEVELLGIRMDDVTLPEAVERIGALVAAGGAHAVVTYNVDHVILRRRDPEFAAAYADAAIRVCDGAPILALSRLCGRPVRARVAGSDLMPAVCAAAARHGWPVAIVGGRPGVPERAAARLRADHPGLSVVATLSPPLGFERDGAASDAVADAVRASGARIVFACLGTPKQEKWVHRQLGRMGPVVALGVGAAVDFTAGTARRAPVAWQRAGFEWLYRLLHEPRLASRYLVRDLAFLPIALREVVRCRLGR